MVPHRAPSARRLAAALVAAGLAGCGTWVHPSKPPEAFHADRLACERHAVSLYPVTIVARMAQPPRVTPATTTCTQQGPQQVCTTVPSTVLPPRWVNEDVNAGPRSTVRSDCLRANGWTFRPND
ncbi:MAG TPA: hypothetical protein VEA81_16450 [Burkholderiaceae bacterium]|nr:hypothetical protein [Burkholderiaceae bacterium]